MSARCAACGRALRDPDSVAAGLGPRCRRSLNDAPPRRGLRLPPAVWRPTAVVRFADRLRRVRLVTLPDIDNYPETDTEQAGM